MTRKKKLLGIFLTLFNIAFISFAVYIIHLRISGKLTLPSAPKILGAIPILKNTPTPSLSPAPTLEPTITPSPTPIEYKAAIVNIPSDLTEGDTVTFTWTVYGADRTIRTTTVYFSKTSTSGFLTKDTAPSQTHYVDRLSDFLDGEYHIPLQFVGNIRIGSPGTYFARAYALIDGKNYWSQEQSFVIKEIPKNKISMIGYPQKVKTGENASFTWEITGPQTTTGYTVIVGGKQSKGGYLDESVEMSLTPYSVLVKDFTGGTYTVPLRFVGNTSFPESGTYFLRAFSSINNKNIWSEEFSMNVE